jgi:hypothetical protein
MSNFEISDSIIGTLLGIRSPKYEILDEVLAPFLSNQPAGKELILFINLDSILRHLFSDYTTAKITKSDLNRHPRLLASGILNLAGHYRHYISKYFNRSTTIVFYYSTLLCKSKLEISSTYKQNFYNKRVHNIKEDYTVLNKYVQFNTNIAKKIAEYIPNLYLVDTYSVDPEVLPQIFFNDKKIFDTTIVISTYLTDYQYILNSENNDFNTQNWAILYPSGDHTKLIENHTLLYYTLGKSKNKEELINQLTPEHFLYMLPIFGDDNLSVDGFYKYGPVKAFKHILQRYQSGFLPGDYANLRALLEEGKFSDSQKEIIERNWKLLIHSDYSNKIPDSNLQLIDSQLINKSGLSEIEKANSVYFENMLNLNFLYDGETY